MSRGGGASKNKVRPVLRDEQAWNPASLAASVQSMYQRVKTHVSGASSRCSGAKRRKRVLAPRKATQAPFTF